MIKSSKTPKARKSDEIDSQKISLAAFALSVRDAG